MLAFAEFEKGMIYERMLAGKEIARTKAGYKEGRPPKYTNEILNYAVSLLENNTYKKVSEITKISVSTLARAKAKKLKNE